MQRSLGAENPDLQAGVPGGREPDGHHIRAAPCLLGQTEQLWCRPRQPDEVEPPVDRRSEDDVAPGAEIVERPGRMLGPQPRQVGPDHDQRAVAVSENAGRRVGKPAGDPISVLREQRRVRADEGSQLTAGISRLMRHMDRAGGDLVRPARGLRDQLRL